MLPLLLMRARKLDDAVMVLCYENFVPMRLMVLDIGSAVQQLKLDCLEISPVTKLLKDDNWNSFFYNISGPSYEKTFAF